MQINFTGTVDEIIELAEVFRVGRKVIGKRKGKPSPAVKAALAANNYIEAIKIRRAETGCGLREAKDFVDAFRLPRPTSPVAPKQSVDCPPDCDCRGGV